MIIPWPAVVAYASGTEKPRIQTISPALSITGHALRSAAEISWPNRADCKSSLTFLGDRACAGKNLSPGRQFLTVTSGASKARFNSAELYPETLFPELTAR